MQKLKDPELSFSQLFGTIQVDTLLRDASTGAIHDGNLNEMLVFPGSKEILCRDWPIMPAVQQMTCVDRLFLPSFDLDPTQELAEISLEGIAQLPVITNNLAKGIHGHENLINFLRTLAELKLQTAT